MNKTLNKIIERFNKKFDNKRTQLYEFSQRLDTYSSCGNPVRNFIKAEFEIYFQVRLENVLPKELSTEKSFLVSKIQIARNEGYNNAIRETKLNTED